MSSCQVSTLSELCVGKINLDMYQVQFGGFWLNQILNNCIIKKLLSRVNLWIIIHLIALKKGKGQH